MSLLDELKQQADSLRQKQQVSQAELNHNLLLAHSKLKDALRDWVELFNSLNIIKPVVPRYYYLDGDTRLDNLLQCDYNVNGRRLTVEHKDYIEAIVLRFRCAGEGTVTIEKQSEPMVQRLRDHLWQNNLKFDVKEVRTDRGYVERGIFTIKSEVPVTVTMVCDLENAHINVMTKNLEKLGEYVYIYDFDEFGKEILEELGKVIIAKPNGFRSIGKRQQSILTTTTRTPKPANAQPKQTVDAAAAAGGDPTSKLIGNIRSLLKL